VFNVICGAVRPRSLMSEELMPQDVRNLIVTHIDSVAQLEALLFLHARPSERWDVASVAKRLYAPFADTAAALAGRHANQLVSDQADHDIAERFAAGVTHRDQLGATGDLDDGPDVICEHSLRHHGSPVRHHGCAV
jgi:hypothetical protein